MRRVALAVIMLVAGCGGRGDGAAGVADAGTSKVVEACRLAQDVVADGWSGYARKAQEIQVRVERMFALPAGEEARAPGIGPLWLAVRTAQQAEAAAYGSAADAADAVRAARAAGKGGAALRGASAKALVAAQAARLASSREIAADQALLDARAAGDEEADKRAAMRGYLDAHDADMQRLRDVAAAADRDADAAARVCGRVDP